MASKDAKRPRGFILLWLSGVFVAFNFLIYQHLHFSRGFQNNGDDLGPPVLKAMWTVHGNNGTLFNVRRRSMNTTNTTMGSVSLMRSITGYYDPAIREFERQEGVVIVTKIHSDVYLPMLEQMLCLFHQAYNHRLKYDIVVFTTEPIDPTLLVNLTSTVAPVHLTVVQDNRGLQQEIADLSPTRRQKFVRDCHLQNEDELKNLTWFSKCPERIAYNHQAEFRSWHIWNHPALKQYHWMMWLDADAFCSKKWTRDPMAIAMQHNLTILFDNFPQGAARGQAIHQRIRTAMNGSLCEIHMTPQGHFERWIDEQCDAMSKVANIPLIHGFFHITNMDFYRLHINWAKILIGNGFLQREFDDQVAVTVPAVYYTPNHSFLLRKVGIELGVFHNGRLDGDSKLKGGGFLRFWNKKGGKELFADGENNCNIITGG